MKEEEIRKRDVLNRYLDLVQEDSDRIFHNRAAFIKINCPACGYAEPANQFDKTGFSYVQCEKCETLFVSPRPAYQDLMKIYVDSPSTRFWVNDFFLPMAEARREKIFKPRAEFIAESFPEVRSGRIADIGAGFGLFLEELKKLWPESDIVAIEPSVDMANICRVKGLNVLESTLEAVSSTERFNLLTAFELFEHLHDPAPFVERVLDLLNPGGYLFLTTLNGLGFDIQILWERAKSVSPPHHLNFFNPQSIERLLDRVGFNIVEISTPGQLDWDIIEGGWRHEGIDPGRFFSTVSCHGTGEAKRDLQRWIQTHNFSSHMRVIAKKR